MPPLHVLRLALAVALTAPWPAAAQAPRIDCAKAVATPEINWCEDQALDRADKALNTVYAASLKRIGGSDVEPARRAEWRRALVEAQRRWVAFRDAECDGAEAFEWQGGTGATAAVLVCKRVLTETRTKDLAERNGR